MLAIRLQRVGRKGLAQYRLIAQEHSVQPTSGKVAAYLGSYNPHTKEAQLDTEKIQHYLSNGAQPSNSAAKLLQRNKIKLPDWVTITTKAPKKTDEPEEVTADATVEETPAAEVEKTAPESSEESAAVVDTPAEESSDAAEPEEAETPEAAEEKSADDATSTDEKAPEEAAAEDEKSA